MEWLTVYLEEFTYLGIAAVLFAAGLGFPIPEDIPLIFGGVMAGRGLINVYVHFAISMAFILIGDSCLFFIGRSLGRHADRPNRFSRVLTPRRRKIVARYFDRWGGFTVFFGRFVAGLRGAVYLTAGAAGFPYGRFVLLDLLAALISVPLWIALGWYFGENWEAILHTAKTLQTWALVGIGALVAAIVVGIKLYRKRSPLADGEEEHRQEEG